MVRQHPRAKRWLAAALLLLLVGCQTWQPTTQAPRAVIMEEGPSAMRFTVSDGAPVTIKDPFFRNDSIVSVNEGLLDLVGVPAERVTSAEIRRFSPGRTALFAAATIAVALGWANAVGGSSGGNGLGTAPLPKSGG